MQYKHLDAKLIGRIRVEQEEIALALANGNAVSFEAYQRLVGEYVGLQRALDIINTLLEEEENVE